MKETRIKIRENDYYRVTSTLNGHNLDVVSFNVGKIARKYPKVAIKIMKLMEKIPSWAEVDNGGK